MAHFLRHTTVLLWFSYFSVRICFLCKDQAQTAILLPMASQETGSTVCIAQGLLLEMVSSYLFARATLEPQSSCPPPPCFYLFIVTNIFLLAIKLCNWKFSIVCICVFSYICNFTFICFPWVNILVDFLL
jgi:hypothetical protein